MDFSTLKQKALELKQKAWEAKDKAINFSAEKMSQSGLILKDQTDLEAFILKSANKVITTQDGEEKVFVKRAILIIADAGKDFFKEFLVSIPILLTKSFSQNLPIKIIDINNKNINIADYNAQEYPAFIVFENKEIYKTITGEDNIKKVVKSLTLDINRTIEEV